MSTEGLEAILNNPMRSYIEQRKFTAFLEEYADIFNPFRREMKSMKQFDSVWIAGVSVPVIW